MYVLSIMLIVISNVFYNIAQKSTPQNANPMAALLVTYLTAISVTLVAFLFTRSEKGFMQSFAALNWTSIVLGFAILGLELGFLLAYRAGWNISVGSLVANILLALMLIPVGILFYHESFNVYKVIGACFCIVGLILINKM
ncbi:MAG TPA: EamA family transporter [Syntrophomonas sp.]|nr:EamA family transporter [Syntrophomonas sp.]HRW12054.1 EamA family transporter [Syntrophomonas sp.]